MCTAALFFSGYVIQQRTLRDLRQAIKPSPRPSPKIFLPDRFQKSTTELEDGTIVIVDDEYDRSWRKPTVVEIKPTQPDDTEDVSLSDDQQQQQPLDTDDEAPTKTEEREADEGKKQDTSANDPTDAEKLQKPISRAERRRRIKEDIQKLSQGEKQGYYQRRLY